MAEWQTNILSLTEEVFQKQKRKKSNRVIVLFLSMCIYETFLGEIVWVIKYNKKKNQYQLVVYNQNYYLSWFFSVIFCHFLSVATLKKNL